MSSERGQFGIIIGIVIAVLVLALIGLFTVCTPDGDNDRTENGLGLVASHDCYRYDDCRDGGSGDEGEQRDDNRRAGISPGPFDRSPVDIHDNRLVVCFPFSRCGESGENDDRQPL